jgi:hypothetical protein
MKLGVAFSVATMSIGNGIFGFLKWNSKDHVNNYSTNKSGRFELNFAQLCYWGLYTAHVILELLIPAALFCGARFH